MKVKCLWCGDIIKNTSLHNMTWCKCHKTALDYHPIWSRIAFTRNDNGNPMYRIVKQDKEINKSRVRV